MKKSSHAKLVRLAAAVAISTLLLSSGVAFAADDAQSIGSAPRPLLHGDLARLKGSFQLNDGRDLSIGSTGRELTATVGSESPVRLVPTAEANKFTSLDGSMHVEFVASSNGSVHGVRMSHETAPTTASSATAVLASSAIR